MPVAASLVSRAVPVSGRPASIGAGIVGVTSGTPVGRIGPAPGDVVMSLGAHASSPSASPYRAGKLAPRVSGQATADQRYVLL